MASDLWELWAYADPTATKPSFVGSMEECIEYDLGHKSQWMYCRAGTTLSMEKASSAEDQKKEKTEDTLFYSDYYDYGNALKNNEATNMVWKITWLIADVYFLMGFIFVCCSMYMYGLTFFGFAIITLGMTRWLDTIYNDNKRLEEQV